MKKRHVIIVVVIIAAAVSLCNFSGPPIIAAGAFTGRRVISRREGLLRSTGLLEFPSRRERYFEGWYYKFFASFDGY
jgi:hypothetical protein